MENFMKRLLCVVLSMVILIPGLNLEVISASAETATFRSYLEPMPNGSSVSDNDAQAEMTSYDLCQISIITLDTVKDLVL